MQAKFQRLVLIQGVKENPEANGRSSVDPGHPPPKARFVAQHVS